MNKKYKDKFAMWEVHDDGEDKLGEYETFQDFQAALSSYYKNANMKYCYGCLCWLGQISHIELRFKDTPLYYNRQEGGVMKFQKNDYVLVLSKGMNGYIVAMDGPDRAMVRVHTLDCKWYPTSNLQFVSRDRQS